MAQFNSFVPQYNQRYPVTQQQSRIDNAFVVVDQRPSRREAFPYRLQVNWILAFGICKVILGSLLFITGVVSVIISYKVYKYQIGFAIWCGLTILANGIFGCILKCTQNKCVIGTFLGLSITSFIFDISMLPFYSVVLDFFVDFYNEYCSYGYYGHYCWKYLASDDRDLNIGITSFLIGLIIFELACSIGSVVVSCKAYSKCCNTCDTEDCCTWVGCCECNGAMLTTQQASQSASPPCFNHATTQMPSVQPQNYEPNRHGAQSNPCSGLVSFIINIPSYVLGTANGTQLSAINVDIEPVAHNQQAPLVGQDRNAEQAQAATSVGGNQMNLPHNTWEQVVT